MIKKDSNWIKLPSIRLAHRRLCDIRLTLGKHKHQQIYEYKGVNTSLDVQVKYRF